MSGRSYRGKQTANWRLAPKARLSLSKYAAKFVRKYLQRYPQPGARLHRHACRWLNSDLYPNLNLDLNLNLYPYLFLNSFRQLSLRLFAASFDSLFVLNYRQL